MYSKAHYVTPRHVIPMTLTPRDNMKTNSPRDVRPKSLTSRALPPRAHTGTARAETPRAVTRVSHTPAPLDTSVPPLDLNDVGAWSDPEELNEYKKVSNTSAFGVSIVHIISKTSTNRWNCPMCLFCGAFDVDAGM